MPIVAFEPRSLGSVFLCWLSLELNLKPPEKAAGLSIRPPTVIKFVTRLFQNMAAQKRQIPRLRRCHNIGGVDDDVDDSHGRVHDRHQLHRRQQHPQQSYQIHRRENIALRSKSESDAHPKIADFEKRFFVMCHISEKISWDRRHKSPWFDQSQSQASLHYQRSFQNTKFGTSNLKLSDLQKNVFFFSVSNSVISP